MAKRFTRKRTFRKRVTKRRGKSMNRMQKAAYSYVKKKYTVVFPITALAGQAVAEATISHVGGRNNTTPANTVTLTGANPDGMAQIDMDAYQFFKITGVSYKLFFPEGTTPEATPVQWSLGYSSNNVINPNLGFGPFQTLANFQTSSCTASRAVKRYFKTPTTLKRLGIEWCNTDEYLNFGVTPPVPLYGGQLPVNNGSSTLLKVFRPDTATATAAQIGRLQVTYYVQYKGAKGVSDLT